MDANMIKLIKLCTIALIVLHISNYGSGYVVDFSRETWPVIHLRVTQLEMEREELLYGGKHIPKNNGLIELECHAEESSFFSSLGPDLAKTVTGVKWILPNPDIVTEQRAYVKNGKYESQLQSHLVITDFNKNLDAGEYGCQLTFQDETITRYHKMLKIPSLDGAPLLQCDLRCIRNVDEECQLMGSYTVDCVTYSQRGWSSKCNFFPCPTDGTTCLPPMVAVAPLRWINPGYKGEPTPMYHEEHSHLRGLASQPGYFQCTAQDNKGATTVGLFMNVTVNQEKTGMILITNPNEPEKPKPDFLGGESPEFRRNEPGSQEFGCWTSRDVQNFEWTFRHVAHREHVVHLTNDTLEGLTVRNYEVLGGHASIIHIEKLSMAHGGYYSCEAANDLLNSLAVKEFRTLGCVWAEDANMNKKATLKRKPGSSVTLKCTMKSTRVPAISWLKRDSVKEQMVNVLSSIKFEFLHDDQEFTIHNLTLEDAGVYKCSATMGGHSMTGELTLQVEEYPADTFEHVEKIYDALMSLKHVEEQLGSIIHAVGPHGAHHGSHDSHHMSHGNHQGHHVGNRSHHDHGGHHMDHGSDHSHHNAGHHAAHHIDHVSHHGHYVGHGNYEVDHGHHEMEHDSSEEEDD